MAHAIEHAMLESMRPGLYPSSQSQPTCDLIAGLWLLIARCLHQDGLRHTTIRLRVAKSQSQTVVLQKRQILPQTARCWSHAPPARLGIVRAWRLTVMLRFSPTFPSKANSSSAAISSSVCCHGRASLAAIECLSCVRCFPVQLMRLPVQCICALPQ